MPYNAKESFDELMKIKDKLLKDKAVMADKARSDAVKKLVGALGKFKPVFEAGAKIDGDRKKLADAIGKHNTDLKAAQPEARSASEAVGVHAKGDSPGRGDFMRASGLLINMANAEAKAPLA